MWGLVVMGVVAGIQAYSKYRASKAEAKAGKLSQEAANLNAGLIDFNAHLTDLQAQDAIERGADAENKFRTTVRGMIGEQRTQFAAAGVDVGYGSPEDAQADAAYLGELDSLQIRTNATREAWGLKVKAVDLRNQAAIMRRTGQLQAEAAAASKGQALISIAGDAASTGLNLYANRNAFK
jgi:hypothetical protein